MGAVLGRWWRSAIIVAAAGWLTGVMVRDGYLLVGLLAAVGLLVIAFLLAPRRTVRPVSHDEARARARREGVLVGYWRPGNGSCERLRTALRGEDGIVWVDVTQDPAADAFVREVNDGRDKVPTVIAGSAVWPNPGAEKVRTALRSLPVR